MCGDGLRQVRHSFSQRESQCHVFADVTSEFKFLAVNKFVSSLLPSLAALDLTQACENCSPVGRITK